MMTAVINPLNVLLLNILQVSILTLELMALLVIVFYSFSAFYSLVVTTHSKPYSDLSRRLGKGLSLGLTFYLAAEILQTATVRSYAEFYMIFLLIVLRTLIALFLQWSLRDANTPSAKRTHESPSAEHRVQSLGGRVGQSY